MKLNISKLQTGDKRYFDELLRSLSSSDSVSPASYSAFGELNLLQFLVEINGSVGLIEQCLLNGYDPFQKNHAGYSAADIAFRSHLKGTIDLINKMTVLQDDQYYTLEFNRHYGLPVNTIFKTDPDIRIELFIPPADQDDYEPLQAKDVIYADYINYSGKHLFSAALHNILLSVQPDLEFSEIPLIERKYQMLLMDSIPVVDALDWDRSVYNLWKNRVARMKDMIFKDGFVASYEMFIPEKIPNSPVVMRGALAKRLYHYSGIVLLPALHWSDNHLF